MEWTLIRKKQCIAMTEQVLHLPGNVIPGKNLEMAIVMDGGMEKEELNRTVSGLVTALKQHGETFRNVRLNTLLWQESGRIQKEVTPMAMLQTGRYLQEYCPAEGEKSIEELLRQLKVYYARSKLVYVISKGDFRIEDPEECRRQLRPFLGRKMIWLLEECPSGLKDCFQGIPLRILSGGTEKAAD